jgi:hypothetical protein
MLNFHSSVAVGFCLLSFHRSNPSAANSFRSDMSDCSTSQAEFVCVAGRINGGGRAVNCGEQHDWEYPEFHLVDLALLN